MSGCAVVSCIAIFENIHIPDDKKRKTLTLDGHFYIEDEREPSLVLLHYYNKNGIQINDLDTYFVTANVCSFFSLDVC